ncbi:factor-independent urate hydroxylase [Geodermatophilus sp. DSM 45219]|uniref:factor-independent urate hydroxylase n=1 Tax=Geodermatophilus sp. DSM 45219 TaxID=1881103 RepID=UPI00088FE5D4|nr:urate oxidase [Geodermatophilus sp. DSM 45219]SDO06533.1 urate oxidase [Geodermatophilus sp. DSM 45219]
MAIRLGPNQYGKAEVRVVAVDRSAPRHTLVDLDVSSSLRGDFTAAHTAGDNGHVLATDTQKNTVFAFARDGVGSPEAFGLRLARHFAGAHEWISGARVAVDSFGWDRIAVGGQPHEHAFRRDGGEVRTAVVTVDGGDAHVLAGLRDLVVLKTTGSEFWGFPRDRYTTLAETRDRILATAVTARWRYTGTDLDWDAAFDVVRTTLLETFAATHSLALQQTLYAMGEAVLERCPDVAEVRLSMPNRHHFLQDLSAFGLDNPDVVYHADDRPYGLIEGTVLRDDVPPAEVAWLGTPGFC